MFVYLYLFASILALCICSHLLARYLDNRIRIKRSIESFEDNLKQINELMSRSIPISAKILCRPLLSNSKPVYKRVRSDCSLEWDKIQQRMYLKDGLTIHELLPNDNHEIEIIRSLSKIKSTYSILFNDDRSVEVIDDRFLELPDNELYMFEDIEFLNMSKYSPEAVIEFKDPDTQLGLSEYIVVNSSILTLEFHSTLECTLIYGMKGEMSSVSRNIHSITFYSSEGIVLKLLSGPDGYPSAFYILPNN